MPSDDRIDNQSNNSAGSSDSGVITDDKFMSDSNQCKIDISTSIDCDNTSATDESINLENILNFAKNVSPTRKGSSKTAYKSSPTFSIRSTNISITSIQSDAVSSVLDSDTDDFDDSNGNFTIKKLGEHTSCVAGAADIPNIGGSDKVVLLRQRVDGGQMGAVATASTSMGPDTTQVGSMAFTNSTDITIGQKNYYQGPVTIQQFLIEGRKREGVTAGGVDNPVFESGSPTGARRKPADHDISKETNASPQPYKFIFNRKAAIITSVIIVLTIVLAVVFVTTSSVLKRKRLDGIAYGNVLRLIPRDEWLAAPPNEELSKLVLPVHRVIIAHTATENCSSQASCTYRTQVIQNFHMDSREFADIAYNFLVGGDGGVYEGRGWDRQGAHTKGFNVDSICIAFIGTFLTIEPPERQLNAAKLIIEEGVRLNKIVTDYQLFGVRQLIGSESPGMALYALIKKWPHWTSKLPIKAAIG